jgi:hypothetical protein
MAIRHRYNNESVKKSGVKPARAAAPMPRIPLHGVICKVANYLVLARFWCKRERRLDMVASLESWKVH